jgi:hypothetical protein
VDSDLNEALSELKENLNRRGCAAKFGRCNAELVAELKGKLKLPRRYRDFLLEADPLNVETKTPSECVRFIASSKLVDEQRGFAFGEQGESRTGPSSNGWRQSWVIVAHSTLLGDPYFLDTALPDAEGDCPVYTAMSGTDQWKPRLCASSFALFVRILALGMEVAEGFAEETIDIDDESLFREALGPKIRQHDPAALKAGHWT